MSWNNYEFKCPRCAGSGDEMCFHCGSEVDCEDCQGTGLDISRIDVARFVAAENEQLVGSGGTWALEENGMWVGRESDKGKLYYRDFLLPGASEGAKT